MSNSFNYNKDNAENRFLDYNGKIILKSSKKNNQIVFNKILSVFNKNKNETLDSDEIKSIWKNVINADSNKDGVITLEEITAYIKRNKVLSKLNINPKNLIWFLNLINNTIGNQFKQASSAVEKRLMTNFKKNYPASKYNIIVEKECGKTTIMIMDKKTKRNVKTCLIEENGDYEISEQKISQVYDKKTGNNVAKENSTSTHYYKNGKLKSHTKMINGKEVNKDPISEAIYKDITAKNKAGLPTTGKNLEKHIKQITPQNIQTVLENYKNNYSKSLLEAINNEWGLDKQVKKRLIQHLNECTKKSRYWSNTEPNTIIDNDMSQGNIGDCWLLGTIAAIAAKPKGLKILNSTIKKTVDGNYLVKFKGADKTYIVTPLEILDRSNFTNQDLDIRILEIAADKHFNFLGINGGYSASALDLLLGTNGKLKNFLRIFNPTDDSTEKLKKLIKDPNTIVTAGTTHISTMGLDEDAPYYDNITSHHIYAVVDIDNKYVYLKNPWKVKSLTKKHEGKDGGTFIMPIEDFKKYFANVQYVTLS